MSLFSSIFRKPDESISVADAHRILQETNPSPLIIDVREDEELAICKIEGSRQIPMKQIPTRLAEIPRDRPVFVVCHHGMRSLNVTRFLRQNGFDNALSIEGGVDAWALEIDPSMKRY